MPTNNPNLAHDLEAIARRAMRERGLEPDFPPAALRQAERYDGPADDADPGIEDLRALPWCSIDNDDSRDLDQLTVAEDPGDGTTRVHVAIADVDALVKLGTPVDEHALRNTTSVYTPAVIFPMLPERLSTDLTSLNPHVDRLAVVVSYTVQGDGTVTEGQVRRARVHNHAKLAYNSVAAWLDGEGDLPEAAASAPGVTEQLARQDAAAQRMDDQRHQHGALTLRTIEARARVEEGRVVDLDETGDNRAQEIIENLMVAANGVTAAFLERRGLPTLRRVVRSPDRWDRIRDLAEGHGETLPGEPDAAALQRFLARRRRADPLRFPDLSLTVVKLMGSGEYAVLEPGREAVGHFGLAVRDYSHSTAPNRRYPDLVTQRLLKAALRERKPPYTVTELHWLAEHCTQQEDASRKVERQVRKSAAALFLADRVGDTFSALVTGVTPRGTWVRLLKPPVEGRLMRDGGLDVGDQLRVRLVSVDVERGYIDFTRAS